MKSFIASLVREAKFIADLTKNNQNYLQSNRRRRVCAHMMTHDDIGLLQVPAKQEFTALLIFEWMWLHPINIVECTFKNHHYNTIATKGSRESRGRGQEKVWYISITNSYSQVRHNCAHNIRMR